MSYYDALNYIAQKTSVIELYDQWGGRVAVCPEWNGRILTSTCDGLKGNSFGYINVQAIEENKPEEIGGEDQWTVSPLVYSFAVESIREKKIVLQRTRLMNDTLGKLVEMHFLRTITLLNQQNLGDWFGSTVADALELEDVSAVGYSTENLVRTQEKAHIASRQRGMYNAHPFSFVIISTPQTLWEEEPFPVEINYLGGTPHGRTRRLPQALLLRADGYGQCQAAMPYSTAPPILGAVEFGLGALTLWTFDMPKNSDSEDDLIRIYNSGRTYTGKSDFRKSGWETYYELNCFSAAKKIQPAETLYYCQHTLHVVADNKTLDGIVQEIFDVSLENFPKNARRSLFL